LIFKPGNFIFELLNLFGLLTDQGVLLFDKFESIMACRFDRSAYFPHVLLGAAAGAAPMGAGAIPDTAAMELKMFRMRVAFTVIAIAAAS
jgi:hypothetical protein